MLSSGAPPPSANMSSNMCLHYTSLTSLSLLFLYQWQSWLTGSWYDLSIPWLLITLQQCTNISPRTLAELGNKSKNYGDFSWRNLLVPSPSLTTIAVVNSTWFHQPDALQTNMIRSVLLLYSAISPTIVVCPTQLIVHRSVGQHFARRAKIWAILAVFWH